MSLRDALADRLLARRNADGSFGYGYRAEGAAEPTALGALALGAAGLDAGPSLEWLAREQLRDGGVPAVVGLDEPCWPTSLALYAWERAAERDGSRAFELARSRSEAWLLEAHGLPMEPAPELFGHDVTLVGWSWARETHSWVEPTALAVLALRARGRGDDARVVAGIALLQDRCLPDGGWNYGNTRVLDHVLRPFAAQTGIALAALAGVRSADDATTRSVAWLEEELPRLRAPFSVGWALLGLRAAGRVPESASSIVEAAATRERPVDPRDDALLVLAAGDDR